MISGFLFFIGVCMSELVYQQQNKRLELIDSIRGITIISMIGFHASWIANYFGLFISSELMNSFGFYVWERTICISFIFISGFVFSLGKCHMKNGILILGLGVGITVLSLLFAYDIRDIFGVLWILGLSPLLMIIPDRIVQNRVKNLKIIALFLLVIFTILFVVSFNINHGYLWLFGIKYMLPRSLYKGIFMTFLGFQEPGFYSVDYFSVIPWFFLYVMGYSAQKLLYGTKFYANILTIKIPIINKIGKHSLLIYLIHPVVIFVVMFILAKIL